MSEAPAGIGAVRRKEDRRLVTGRGRFVADLQLPRMRHVAFLRSPLGHAGSRRRRRRGPRGRVPGVHRAATSPPSRCGPGPRCRPTSRPTNRCWPTTRCVSPASRSPPWSPTDRYLAEDGRSWSTSTTNRCRSPCRPGTGRPRRYTRGPGQCAAGAHLQRGRGRRRAGRRHLVVERELVTNRHAGQPMECRAGVACGTRRRQLTFWTGTQVPAHGPQHARRTAGPARGQVRVVAPDVGGGFGVKSVLYPEDVTLCLMARAMPGVPLKWVEDRAEHLLAATPRPRPPLSDEAGFAADGTLLALDADVTCNVGAHSVYPWTAGIEPLMAGGLLTGPYKLDNYRCTVRGVATNTAPAGPYRGVARPATVFAMEALFDEAAARLGIDPVELRRRNAITPEDIPYGCRRGWSTTPVTTGNAWTRRWTPFDYDDLPGRAAPPSGRGGAPIGIGIALLQRAHRARPGRLAPARGCRSAPATTPARCGSTPTAGSPSSPGSARRARAWRPPWRRSWPTHRARLRRRRRPPRRHRRGPLGLRRVLLPAGGHRRRGGTPGRARRCGTRCSHWPRN